MNLGRAATLARPISQLAKLSAAHETGISALGTIARSSALPQDLPGFEGNSGAFFMGDDARSVIVR